MEHDPFAVEKRQAESADQSRPGGERRDRDRDRERERPAPTSAE
jgi:hypothetical protein